MKLLTILATTAALLAQRLPDLRPITNPALSGSNIEPIIRGVARSFPPKSEFETDQQYLDRTEMRGDGPLLTIVLDRDPTTAGVDFTYDADKQSMVLRLTNISTGRNVIVQRRVKSRRTYVGTNAFGVKFAVAEMRSDDYGIPMDTSKVRRLEADPPVFEWPMDASIARQVKPSLMAVVLCRQIENRLYSYIDRHEPTISEPQDTTRDCVLLSVRPECLIVFDSRSGKEVFRSPDASQGKGPRAIE